MDVITRKSQWHIGVGCAISKWLALLLLRCGHIVVLNHETSLATPASWLACWWQTTNHSWSDRTCTNLNRFRPPVMKKGFLREFTDIWGKIWVGNSTEIRRKLMTFAAMFEYSARQIFCANAEFARVGNRLSFVCAKCERKFSINQWIIVLDCCSPKLLFWIVVRTKFRIWLWHLGGRTRIFLKYALPLLSSGNIHLITLFYFLLLHVIVTFLNQNRCPWFRLFDDITLILYHSRTLPGTG